MSKQTASKTALGGRGVSAPPTARASPFLYLGVPFYILVIGKKKARVPFYILLIPGLRGTSGYVLRLRALLLGGRLCPSGGREDEGRSLPRRCGSTSFLYLVMLAQRETGRQDVDTVV